MAKQLFWANGIPSFISTKGVNTITTPSIGDFSDNTGIGEIINFGSGTTVAGKLYYLHTTGAWTAVDADAVASGATQLLAIALGTAPSTDGMLIKGVARVDAGFVNGTPVVGKVVYISEEVGEFDFVAPSGTNDFIRAVGYCLATTGGDILISFDPSQEYVELPVTAGAEALNDLDDVTYSTDDGDLTITSLDTIIAGALTIDSSGDITLDADGDQVTMKFGSAAGQIDFSNENSGDGIIQQKVDSKDLVFKQYDGYEVARVHDNEGMGGFGYRKLIVNVDTALDLSSVADAIPYSGAVFSVEMSGETAIEITLPTATTNAEGAKLTGWNCSVIIATAAVQNVTIVRGDDDTGPDYISGIVLSGDATPNAMTIGSNVVTFVGALTAAGNRVDITCIGADEDNTFYSAQAFCGQ